MGLQKMVLKYGAKEGLERVFGGALYIKSYSRGAKV
jgi:hypothetical protein